MFNQCSPALAARASWSPHQAISQMVDLKPQLGTLRAYQTLQGVPKGNQALGFRRYPPADI